MGISILEVVEYLFDHSENIYHIVLCMIAVINFIRFRKEGKS